jgi:hypothetical protein
VELLAIAAVAGLVLLLALVASRPVAVFTLTIKDGKVRASAGQPGQLFLDEAQLIVTDCGIESGVVRGVRKWRRVALEFSPHIPARYRQRFRNVWALYGPALTPGRPAGRRGQIAR